MAELTIERGSFLQCGVKEQGGALHVSGAGAMSVANSSFEDCTVGYSAEPICLTLTMIHSAGTGCVVELWVSVF